MYYYSYDVNTVSDGVVQEWLSCLNKKDNIKKDKKEFENCKVERAPIPWNDSLIISK